MAKEIERKFLVKDKSFISAAFDVIDIAQGYLSVDPDRVVRVRIAGEKAFLTVKTRNNGPVRHEWEYEIPIKDAGEMLQSATHTIAKTRYFVKGSDGHVWEVDCFKGGNEGLIVAEIELADTEIAFEIPDFVGEEVTGDARYYNSNLAAQV